MTATSHLNPYFASIEENAETSVRKLLRETEWDGTVPVDLMTICDLNDWGPDFIELPDMKEEGKTELSLSGCRIVLNTHGKSNKTGLCEQPTERRRQRFTLAHEIGHCYFRSHSDYELQEALQDKANIHHKTYNRTRESQANGFAANLLIPTDHFKEFLKGKSYKDLQALVDEISDTYDVSFETAIQRLAAMTGYPCMAIVFKDGKAKRVPSYSSDFQETKLFFAKGDPIPATTSAHRLHIGRTDADYELTNYRTAGTWFPNKPWLSDKFTVKERSFNMGAGRIITFLEIEEVEQNWY
jgi:hypothetical protein